MRNKILIGIVLTALLSILTISYIYYERLNGFKESLVNIENKQIAEFRNEKDQRLKLLSKGDNRILELFNEQFNESTATIEKDTLFSFLFFTKYLNYNILASNYLDCLTEKCILDKSNEIVQDSINKKNQELKNKYEPTFNEWYPKLKDKLLISERVMENCSYFFDEIYKISFDENIWNEFELFMKFYNEEINNEIRSNQIAENQFNSSVSNTKSKLKSGVLSFFNEKLSDQKSQILQTEKVTKTYNTFLLGTIAYEVEKTRFNKQVFQEVEDAAFDEQWKYNSLRTGNMPYSNCYGSSNSCNDWNCSKINVITDGSGDVLVTIKNSNGRVIRHAYIRGGDSYTFNVSDGSYQVFFYSGNGWNPNKSMYSTSCNSLKGGFVSNENVSKDDYIDLYSQVMTYELILQEAGNFSTKPSSKNEAF